eukprot:364679-Chlamydomonas_euryale.AAC.1
MPAWHRAQGRTRGRKRWKHSEKGRGLSQRSNALRVRKAASKPRGAFPVRVRVMVVSQSCRAAGTRQCRPSSAPTHAPERDACQTQTTLNGRRSCSTLRSRSAFDPSLHPPTPKGPRPKGGGGDDPCLTTSLGTSPLPSCPSPLWQRLVDGRVSEDGRFVRPAPRHVALGVAAAARHQHRQAVGLHEADGLHVRDAERWGEGGGVGWDEWRRETTRQGYVAWRDGAG